MATAIERISQKLLKRLQELNGSCELDVGPVAGDALDYAFASNSAAMQSVLAEHNAEEIGKITEALARIRTGTYGTCANCRHKIPTARLQALPYSTLCIACQRASEAGSFDRLASTDIALAVDFVDDDDDEGTIPAVSVVK